MLSCVRYMDTHLDVITGSEEVNLSRMASKVWIALLWNSTLFNDSVFTLYTPAVKMFLIALQPGEAPWRQKVCAPSSALQSA